MAETTKLLSLVDDVSAEYTDAGRALSDDFLHLITPIIARLVEQGYDSRHVESIMIRDVLYTATMERLRAAASPEGR